MRISQVFAVLFGLGTQLWSQGAAAEDKWIITDFAARDVDASSVATFHDLLRDEIQVRNGVTFGSIASVCGDAQCARAAGAGTGASTAVQGSVHRLGSKLVVSVSAVEIASGHVTFSQRLSVDRVEDLELAAKRLAEALVHGESVEDTAELGTITHQEAENPTRRDSRLGALIDVQALLPTRGYADRQFGAGVGVGAFFETARFIIEPTASYRFAMGNDRDAFHHLAFELAFSYLFSLGDLAPFAGAGLGLHYLNETVYVTRTVGTLLPSTSDDRIHDSEAGFSVFPRVGILFLRTYDVSLELTVDYALTLADFQERSNEQAVRIGVGLIMGGT